MNYAHGRSTCCQPCWHCFLQSDPKKFPKGDPSDCRPGDGGPGDLGAPGHGSRGQTECQPRLPEAEVAEVKFQASEDGEEHTVTHVPAIITDGTDQPGLAGLTHPAKVSAATEGNVPRQHELFASVYVTLLDREVDLSCTCIPT